MPPIALPPPPIGGGGGSYNPPVARQVPAARPTPPGAFYTPDDNFLYYNEEGQEVHGAVSRADCYEMERKFRRQGRRLKLVDVQKNKYNLKGGVLRYLCIFEGDEAVDNWFDDNRQQQENY
jgi:hypothetical protein